MPNTITSYTTFVAGTKARATQVNANFDNHRGTLIPINSDTVSSSDNTHDVGTSEHTWGYGYINNIVMKGATTTGWSVISGRSDLTGGGFDIRFGTVVGPTTTAVTLAVFMNDKIRFKGATTTANLDFKPNISATTGGMDVLINDVTVGSWNSNGYNQSTRAPAVYTTTSVVLGNISFSNFASGQRSDLTTSAFFTLTSHRINTKGGGIVHAAFACEKLQISNSGLTIGTAGIQINLMRGATATAMVTLAAFPLQFATTTADNSDHAIVPGCLFWYDNSYAAGEVIYEWGVRPYPTPLQQDLIWGNGSGLIKEM